MGFIQSYIDGELSYNTRKKFTKHLDACEVCQDLVIKISNLNRWENVMLEEKNIYSSQEIQSDVVRAWEIFENLSKLENVSYMNQKTV